MLSFFGWPALRAALLGALLVMVSLPLVLAAHTRFELGAPPARGLWTLAVGIIGIFVGAAWIGVFLGTSRASGAVAALVGWGWGVALSFLLASFYSHLVVVPVLREAKTIAGQNHDRIENAPSETLEQARAGHASKDAALAGTDFSDGARDASLSSAAHLPALGLLVWALLVPPALSAFEYRRARRQT